MSHNIGYFIKQAVEELNLAMPEGWELDHSIHFEVTVTTTETAEGKIDIRLFSAGSNTKGEAVQKMSFNITHKAKAEAAEQGQYQAVSEGLLAILKPLQEFGKQSLPNVSDTPNPK